MPRGVPLALRHELIGLGGVVERNWYLVKRYAWWELTFFFWTVANTMTIVFIAKGVEAAKTTLTAAEQKKKVDAAAGQVSVETSRESVVAAQNALNSASSDRPHAIDQQLALVDGAEALVRSAQQDVDDGTLTAPDDGVISAVNGAVDEYLSPASGTTAI